MKIAYGIVQMSGHHLHNSTSYALWSYDLDEPRAQRAGLPQGATRGLVGVYRTKAAALAAAERALEGGR